MQSSLFMTENKRIDCFYKTFTNITRESVKWSYSEDDIVVGWLCGNQRRQGGVCCGASFSTGSARSRLCQRCKQGAGDHFHQAGEWKHYTERTAVGSFWRSLQ